MGEPLSKPFVSFTLTLKSEASFKKIISFRRVGWMLLLSSSSYYSKFSSRTSRLEPFSKKEEKTLEVERALFS